MPASPWRMVAVAAASLTISIGTVVIYTFGLFVKPLGVEFGWSRGDVSLALSLANLMVAACSPWVGRLSDRVGAWRIVVPALAALALVMAACAAMTAHLSHLYLLYALAGITGAASAPPVYSRVVATWFTRHRGLALGLTNMGVGLGSFFVSPLVQFLISSHGWRSAYAALGALVVIVPLPLAALFLRESERPSHANQAKEPSTAPNVDRSAALGSRAFWQMAAIFFCVALSLYGTVSHMAPLLTDRGLSPGGAAFAISLFGISSMAGRVLTGFLVDHFFAPYVMAAFFTAAWAGILLLNAGGSGSLAAILFGLGIGAEVDVMPYLVSRYFGFRSLGEILGWTFSSFTLGVATGPLLVGKAFDATGNYSSALTACAGVMAFAVALTLALPAYKE